MEIALPAEIDSLSPDAKAVAGAWFGMMVPGRSDGLRFAMIEYRPTARAQAGLDELLAVGLIERNEERHGAVVYRPLISFAPLLAVVWAEMEAGEDRRKIPNLRLVEKIDAGRAALKSSEARDE